MAEEILEVGAFGDIVSGTREGGAWAPGSFPMPDGGAWVYQEPEAVVVIQNGELIVSVPAFTRANDQVQFFDNAKHMYWSTRQFAAPEGGALTLEWEQSARILGAREGDLYDGFVSFHLLDLAQGVALNFFVGNDVLSTVHAHLPFPGATAPVRDAGPKYFCWFDELRGKTEPGEWHRYSIRVDAGERSITWRMDGEEVKRAEGTGALGPFTLAMGLMTEKDIVPGKGSVSCHGQGAQGRWRNIRAVVETR